MCEADPQADRRADGRTWCVCEADGRTPCVREADPHADRRADGRTWCVCEADPRVCVRQIPVSTAVSIGLSLPLHLTSLFSLPLHWTSSGLSPLDSI